MKNQFIIEPPTVERVFTNLLEQSGHHGAKAIPVRDAFEMFKAYFDWETSRNNELQKLATELLSTRSYGPRVMQIPLKREEEQPR